MSSDRKEYHKEYRIRNADKIKKYREDNKVEMKEYLDNYYSENKPRISERNKKHYKENKTLIRNRQNQYANSCKGKRIKFAAHIRRVYNLSVEEYAWMFYNQKGLCLICQREFNSSNVCVDHDHKTGKVRGLLCKICNRYIIGNLETFGIDSFKRAFEYLGLKL